MAANTKTTTTKTNASKAKAPAKRTRKAPAKPEPVAATRRPNRSDADWDAVVPTIVKALRSGTSMTDIRAQYGAGPTIRKALWRNGFDTKGNAFNVEAIKGTGKVLATRVAKARQSGASWGLLQLRTGKPESDLKALLAKHGQLTLAQGRVVISKRGKARLAKEAVAA